MDKKFINPDTMHTPRGYTHVVTVQGAGRMIFVSGQVAIDKEGQIVGQGDLKTQARKAAENLVSALKGAGATLSDVVKMNTYVVNYKEDDYRAIAEMRGEVFPKENPPASTLIGVAALAVEGLLIEMEAVAAIP
jgi:enamine deaminase RidA (YjgF/YER057c/UK114 family)